MFGQNTQENLCIIFFNKDVEFINIERILRDPDITSSLPTISVKFPIPMVTYKLGLNLSSKIFNLNQFVNKLNLDAFFIKSKNTNSHVIMMGQLVLTNIINIL